MSDHGRRIFGIRSLPVCLPNKISRLISGEFALPKVMKTLNNRPLHIQFTKQVVHRAALAKRIDGPTRTGSYIQVILQPLMPLDQLIQEGVVMRSCLIRHHPATGRDLQATRVNEGFEILKRKGIESQIWNFNKFFSINPHPLLISARPIPPLLQEGYIVPNKGQLLELHELFHDIVQDGLHPLPEIPIERVQPPSIRMRMGNQEDFQWRSLGIP